MLPISDAFGYSFPKEPVPVCFLHFEQHFPPFRDHEVTFSTCVVHIFRHNDLTDTNNLSTSKTAFDILTSE